MFKINNNILKNWTLPFSMSMGIILYFLLAKTHQLAPVRPIAKEIATILTPIVIFLQLFFTFCKVEPKALIPHKWHWVSLETQLILCFAMLLIILFVPSNPSTKTIFIGALVCLICPTATAAAIITAKLGGNITSLTTYTLISNFLATLTIPFIYPIAQPDISMEFSTAFLRIFIKVFPLLLSPFFTALILRYFLPQIHSWFAQHSGIAFYIWGFGLCIVVGQTTHYIMTSNSGWWVIVGLALAGLASCVLQFFIGKYIGKKYNDIVSSGQALGQKNTMLAIWTALTYLNPITALAPGSYVLWQNAYNSWQLFKYKDSH